MAEPITPEPLRVTKAFTTNGIVSPLSQAIPILVGIDIHTEVDLVNIKLVQQLGLKPYRNTNLLILQAVNQQNLYTYRAYNIQLELTDNYRVRRTTLHPYLAIDQDPGDSQILLEITALIELQILIDCQTYQQQYKLDKTSIRINTAQHFKRHTKGAIVYTLVEINHLLSSESLILASQLPKCL